MNAKIVYFPGLNGLRAIAAIAVVISHITLSLKEFRLNPFIFGAFDDGNPKGLYLAGYGVTVFFVLSGFLITYLLQAEKDNQEISIKKFYMRRILRIWPLYYLYLILAILTIIIFGLNLNVASLFLYIFYAANVPFIMGTSLDFISHYWSLGVEEQFYLFWPWLNKKIKHLAPVIVTLLFVIIGIKFVSHLFFPGSILESVIHITRFHCMMIGALGAIFFKSGNEIFLQFVDNKLTQVICWIIMFLVAINKFHIASFIDNEIIACIALFIIIGQIKIKNRIVNLEIEILDFLGKISYGIYVIHPLIIFFFSNIFNLLYVDNHYKYFIIYTSITVTTVFISYISYNYFEKFFLKFKSNYVVVQSTASKLELIE